MADDRSRRCAQVGRLATTSSRRDRGDRPGKKGVDRRRRQRAGRRRGRRRRRPGSNRSCESARCGRGGAFYWEVDRAELGEFPVEPFTLATAAGQSRIRSWSRTGEGVEDPSTRSFCHWMFRALSPGTYASCWTAEMRAPARSDEPCCGDRPGRWATAVIARRYSLAGVVVPEEGRRWVRTSLRRGCWQPTSGNWCCRRSSRERGTCSRVVLLPFGRSDEQPRAVLKLPRSREHNWATEREQSSLAQVRSLLPPQLAATRPGADGRADLVRAHGRHGVLSPGPAACLRRTLARGRSGAARSSPGRWGGSSSCISQPASTTWPRMIRRRGRSSSHRSVG